MGFLLEHIQLHNWRNFSRYALDFSPTLTILHGHNAAGKTNIIEACEFITNARSFRKPLNTQLIRQDQEQAQLQAQLKADARRLDLALTITAHNKLFSKNDKKISPKDITQLLPSVTFTPDDLLFIKQSAQFRRDEFDSFGACISTSYQTIVKTYQQLLTQRNALLKQAYIDEAQLNAWDIQFAKGAAALLFARFRLVMRIQSKIAHVYQQLTHNEQLEIFYRSSLFEDEISTTQLIKQQEFLSTATKDDLLDYIYKKLQTIHSQELARAQSLIGPQRDDIIFYVNHKPARAYASQGQQRSCVLAQKIAEVLVVKDITQQYPLLLLDDVMSELDEQRREQTLEFIHPYPQTILTTTNLSYFSQHVLDTAKVVTINADTRS